MSNTTNFRAWNTDKPFKNTVETAIYWLNRLNNDHQHTIKKKFKKIFKNDQVCCIVINQKMIK